MKKVAIIALCALLAAACTAPPGPDGPERVVFTTARDFKDFGPTKTIDEIDDGLPLLHNQTAHTVKILSVRLAYMPRSVRIDSVTAYKYARAGSIEVTRGNLLNGPCRKFMPPYPVTDVVVAPHKDANWFVLIGFTVSKPGKYYFKLARIDYISDGQRGWQYQDLNLHLYVSKPKPGEKPIGGQC